MKEVKNTQQVLEKLGIEELNPMQQEALSVLASEDEVILLSPTGTGKTVAFLLPVIAELKRDMVGVQALILAPSRELATQIEQVLRDMGTGFKVNAIYGGRATSQDKLDLQHPPTVLVGTPGRVADHFRRESFSLDGIHTLVLDEFDKSLEIGFEGEMSEILAALPSLQKKILTSATQKVQIPEFVGLCNPKTIDYLDEGVERLQIKTVVSPDLDKLPTLLLLLKHLGNQPGIVFCNFRDSIERVSEFLTENGLEHDCFYGGMEQRDRERALIRFRNGTHNILLATDLAARGIDVPEIQFIIHFELPPRPDEFTHRNGRTARMNAEGTAYVLKWNQQDLPHFIKKLKPPVLHPKELQQAKPAKQSGWTTLYVTGGRRDKISKGDIAGLFMKQGKLKSDELGLIEIKQDCAFVAVRTENIEKLLPLVTNTKLKKKKVRVSEIQ